MGSQPRVLHIFFIPFLGDGHIIPLTDTARLFAGRDSIKATIITTPVNAVALSRTIERDRKSGLDISIQAIPFPSAKAGLPEGLEVANRALSGELFLSFYRATALLQQPFEQLVEEHQPDAIVFDALLSWAGDVASRHGIPRIVFRGSCCFSYCVIENIRRHSPHREVLSESDFFVVPGLPHPIEMTKSQLYGYEGFSNWLDKMEVVELESFGIIINSFYEMEPAYADYYRKEMRRNAWQIGPVSLHYQTKTDMSLRGNHESSIHDQHHCLNWLDSKGPNSVIYVSFGSAFSFGAAQLLEIAVALEASQLPFIWVVNMSGDHKERDLFLPNGFEERLVGRGLIIRDWAPQLLILNHPAVGGFMTHCGWNSTLESISSGIPMVTWPLAAEQFYNECLVTQVLKIGFSAGNLVWNASTGSEQVFLTSDKIQRAVSRLMDNGEEAQDVRNRARELAEMANRAVKEGGSSYTQLTALIDALRAHNLTFPIENGPVNREPGSGRIHPAVGDGHVSRIDTSTAFNAT